MPLPRGMYRASGAIRKISRPDGQPAKGCVDVESDELFPRSPAVNSIAGMFKSNTVQQLSEHQERLNKMFQPVFHDIHEQQELMRRAFKPVTDIIGEQQKIIQKIVQPNGAYTAAITAQLTQTQAITTEALRPALEAIAMCQQPYISMLAAMTEYQRTLERITRVPELMKIQNTILQLEHFIPAVIMPPMISNISTLLPALEYLHTEQPDSYQQINNILSVELNENTSIEQYIQNVLLKIKDTAIVKISDLPQYLFGLAQSLDLISPFVDEPARTSIDQLNSLLIVLAYVILQNIPKSK